MAERTVGRLSRLDVPGSAAVARDGSRQAVRRHRVPLGGAIGLALVLLLVAAALIGPWLVGSDPARQDLRGRLAPPVWDGGTSAHPLGTDQLGRDLLARIVQGARVSLAIGVTATLLAGAVGVLLGMVAGYVGGIADRLISFAVDVQQTIPFVVVAIGVATVLRPSLRNVIVVLAVTGWVGYARIVRLQAMALRQAPFVEAARAIGVAPRRILTRHILPNVVGPTLVIASQQVAAMILYEAALSYLGLGAPGETISWGGMVAGGRETMTTAWWVAALPGAAIVLTVLGFNLLGDWLRDVLDPATRGGTRRR
ncbi:MAG: peptide/nickel transport system permease protein [Thermomicrobiales bacterium]|jgi:peptide/nickel transport system permease protein|nr:peptide/nickel transport system permease protein [Thermomicrobiales bacterium]